MNSNISLVLQFASMFPWAPIALAGIYGTLIGSFLNVVIYRVPVMLVHGRLDRGPRFNLAWPPSACPKCQNPIRARHNVPVLGWIALKGMCYDCKAPISGRYPFIEVLTGLLMALIAWFSERSTKMSAAQTIFIMFYVSMLIAIAGIAFDTHKTQMMMSAPLLVGGFIFSVLRAGPVDFFLFENDLTPEYSLISACVGAGVSFLLSIAIRGIAEKSEQLRGKIGQCEFSNAEHMLMAALGAWLGWKTLLLLVPPTACVIYFAAALLPSFAGNHQVRRPLSPTWATAAGGIAAIFFRF